VVDIPRKPVKKKRKYIIGGVAIALVTFVTVALARMEPAAPEVERATVWVDTVRRGPMVRQVRGPGTLVPEQMRWITAVTAGRVEQIHVRAGAVVTPDSPLMELSNPDVQLEALEAQRQLTSAESELVNLRTSLETQRLQQRSNLETVRKEHLEAQRNATLFRTLGEKNLASEMELKRAVESAEELKNRLDLEGQRLKVLEAAIDRQIAFQERNVERLRAIVQFQENRVKSMQVKAGVSGVVQEMSWEPGQWANPGAVLARVAEPGRLKAVLRIPETQAKDLEIGQTAQIDTRNGIITGSVMRIDPAAVNGTVTVDVRLEGELPKGARPDLSVDGTIELERLPDVLHVGRPAYGQAESTVGLFKMEPDGTHAVRMSVKLGRSSVNEIEIQNGLREGDIVILSDLSQYDSYNRIRLR
jgi:multidrug resistance efflux pump